MSRTSISFFLLLVSLFWASCGADGASAESDAAAPIEVPEATLAAFGEVLKEVQQTEVDLSFKIVEAKKKIKEAQGLDAEQLNELNGSVEKMEMMEEELKNMMKELNTFFGKEAVDNAASLMTDEKLKSLQAALQGAKENISTLEGRLGR